jgi:hypothetical protein
MRLLILLTVALLSFDSSAQCYEKYRKAFNERDAFDVTDSVYEDVIISVREGTSNDCFLGKVTVKGGKVLLDNFYIKLEDGSYENIGIRFKTYAPVEIKKGISQIILDKRDNLYNVIFLDHLKPPKKGYMKAPDFDLD